MFRQRQNVERKMGEVAANAAALLVGLERGSGGAGMLVAEGDVIVHEIADRLDPRPAERRRSEQAPGLVGQPIGLAIAAAKQEQQGVRRQVLNLVLQGVQFDRIRHAAVAHDGVGAEAERARGRDQAIAPVAEAVAIAFDGDRRPS